MRVVLKEDVVGLGDIGQNVSVRRGYARNFLIPRGLAFEVGTAHAREIAHKMMQVEAKKKRYKGAAEEEGKRLKNLVLKTSLRVGTGGKVFGSITSREISDKCKEQGFDIDRRRVILSEPIKKTGTHYVEVKLHPEVKVQVRVDVEAIQASREEEDKETDEVRTTLESASADRQNIEVENPAEGEVKSTSKGKKAKKSKKEE